MVQVLFWVFEARIGLFRMTKLFLLLKALLLRLLLPKPIKKQSTDIYSGSLWSFLLRPRMSFEMPRDLYSHSVYGLKPRQPYLIPIRQKERKNERRHPRFIERKKTPTLHQLSYKSRSNIALLTLALPV
jgi:hypothetical protein